jgi:aspartyl protease family protein
MLYFISGQIVGFTTKYRGTISVLVSKLTREKGNKMRQAKRVWILGWLCLAHAAVADPAISVQALLPDRVMLYIDGQSRLLQQGETSPEGVTLIRSDSESALLEVGGEQYIYRLGQVLSNVAPAPVEQRTLRIVQDSDGSYRTPGWINGYPVNLLVDTGASLIAFNSQEAERLGVDYRQAPKAQAETAGGLVVAYEVRLDSVKAGDLELSNIPAMVLEGAYPSEVLLGMSFLRGLEMEHLGRVLELRQKR